MYAQRGQRVYKEVEIELQVRPRGSTRRVRIQGDQDEDAGMRQGRERVDNERKREENMYDDVDKTIK